jgi:xanthine dehydrogenase YagS FAD-binding subunit
MKAFEYAGPESVEDAVKLLGADGAAALSGGTDLINRMKDYVTSPKRLVHLGKIKPLCGVEEKDGLTIGAGTKLAEVLESGVIREKYPAIYRATLEVGTPQIRNMASVGGNLLQRPRCWYFRNGLGLLGGRKQDGKSLVRELEGEFAPIDVSGEGQGGHVVRLGDNRYHAIFMTDQDALFVAPSSLAPSLIALGAKATLVGPNGERTVGVEELYQVPKKDGDLELTLAPGELLTKVTVPAARNQNATYEVRQKQSHDWPLVLCSVCLELDGEKVSKARVILGGVAPIPYRSEAAEKAITGQPLSREATAAAGKAAVADAKPLSMNAYKVRLARVCVDRALQAAAGNRYWEA